MFSFYTAPLGDIMRTHGVSKIWTLLRPLLHALVTSKVDHCILPVEQHIEYKILLIHPQGCAWSGTPDYLKELLESYRPGRNLKSANKLLLKTQSYQLKTYGYRAFSVCAPNLWNSLPIRAEVVGICRRI